MTDPSWPLFDLRVSVGALTLRPMTEADLPGLAMLLPADVELDPRLPAYRTVEPQVGRRIQLYQSYWHQLGNWRPESWRLPFVAFRDGATVGVQGLEGTNFALLRVVETYSWVVAGARRQGVGRAMRLGVLALAFDHLSADVAETEALADNPASLAVSQSLSYVDNGVGRHDHAGQVVDMLRMRMTRARWAEEHTGHGVRVAGVDACRHLFGLD